MVELGTRYMGKSLKSPLVASASPLSETLSGVRELEDAGAGAVVLYSLFEEQLTLTEEQQTDLMARAHNKSVAETLALRPSSPRVKGGPVEYLEHLRGAKAAVDIPIIASLNGGPSADWPSYARLCEQAGADAVELNLYHVPTDPTKTAVDVEDAYLRSVSKVKKAVGVPVAVKLHPFFTSLPHTAREMKAAGADALVLFNRFYQPDVDLENMRVRTRLELSTPAELRLPLRWTSILTRADSPEIAISSGIHSAEDALRALAAGASVAMVCSTLLKKGIPHLRTLNQRLRVWLEARGWSSVEAFRGSLVRTEDGVADIQRAQYMRTLQDWDCDSSTPG